MMENLKLEGETLGQKHQHYNNLLKEEITNAAVQLNKIDYAQPDIDNLFKIDIASKKQDLDYILEVFKCEDMLYVSRALKRSVWLITDIKYADIIDPAYLHTQLLPQMTSKAGNKLMLTVRLNLKDEKRVEQFYKYYEEKAELTTALKWLPNCSISCIENVVEKHARIIQNGLLKRLCEKSVTILEIYARKNSGHRMWNMFSNTTFLLNNYPDKFISIINSQKSFDIPRFTPKATQIIMKTRPDIIIDNFEKYSTKINIQIFVKFLKKENILDFLMKQFKNENLKSWFTFENIKHFILRMPSDSRFDFIRRMCIEKDHNSDTVAYDSENNAEYNKMVLYCASYNVSLTSNAHIYRWYAFAPFSVAFTDLKKLIRAESNPSERNEIFAVLLTCANRKSQNLFTLLKYYRDKHMNEPFKFKSHFVNMVLSKSISHRLDDKTWTILNDIFCSMEVYSENENNVQSCLKHIIVYKVLHDTKVPDIVEKKFDFNTLKLFQCKLNDEEKVKVFDYLYEFITTKIQNFTLNSESELNTLKQHIISVLSLLSDWKKNLLDYSIVMEKIREVIKINNDKCWIIDLSDIYNVNKSWRKYMFKDSLYLHPTQETCINALKHGPEILVSRKEVICLNDSMILTRLFRKLRIYWPETLAKAFEDTFRAQLNDITKHKTSVRGLCVLLPRNQFTDILGKYKPSDTKINWTETDNFTLSIQKNFAKYMSLARPHPPVDIILTYARGDYLQFVLPSVQSILFNISCDQSIKHIPKLIDAPVSLQKHGLKIAFAKLKVDELLPTCQNTWKSTKNYSIRATIFKLVFELLCKEQNEDKMMEIWHVLGNFIDNLTSDENRIIYVTLANARNVPLRIKQAYCIKSYRCLKSLPPTSTIDKLTISVLRSTLDIMEFIDDDFIVEVILDSLDEKFTKTYYNYTDIVSTYLLSTKSEAIQTQRYEKIFVPLLKKYLSFLEDTNNKIFNIKRNFKNLLCQLRNDVENITIEKNMISPIKLFNDIFNDLDKNFSSEDNYVLILTWKLSAKYMQVFEKYRCKSADMREDQPDNESDDSKANLIYSHAAPEFGKICMEQLQEETTKYFPSIYMLFSKAVDNFFTEFNFNFKSQLATLRGIQDHADISEGHLLVLELVPKYCTNCEEKEERRKIFDILSCLPSTEVRMRYQHMLRENEMYED